MHVHFIASRRSLIDTHFPNMETVAIRICILMAPGCTRQLHAPSLPSAAHMLLARSTYNAIHIMLDLDNIDNTTILSKLHFNIHM